MKQSGAFTPTICLVIPWRSHSMTAPVIFIGGRFRCSEFDFPATLYLTTYYSHYNRPVFDLMCSYLLWKGRETTLDLKKFTGKDLKLELSDSVSRDVATSEIRAFARDQKLSAEDKTSWRHRYPIISVSITRPWSNVASCTTLRLMKPGNW